MLIEISRLRNDYHLGTSPRVETVEIGSRELMRLLIHSDDPAAFLLPGWNPPHSTRVPRVQPKPSLQSTKRHPRSQMMDQST